MGSATPTRRLPKRSANRTFSISVTTRTPWGITTPSWRAGNKPSMAPDLGGALASAMTDALPKPLAGRDSAVQYGMALLTVVLVAAPLIPVLYQSLLDRALYDAGQQFTLANFGRLFQTDGCALVFWNTAVFGTLPAVISQPRGARAAVLFGRPDMPAARLFGELFL